MVERDGRVILLAGGRRSTFLDISRQVSTDGEGGLLSMAFAPDYARSGRFYLYYTDTRGYTRRHRPVRATEPDRARSGS